MIIACVTYAFLLWGVLIPFAFDAETQRQEDSK
jgi:hypothetical protein